MQQSRILAAVQANKFVNTLASLPGNPMACFNSYFKNRSCIHCQQVRGVRTLSAIHVRQGDTFPLCPCMWFVVSAIVYEFLCLEHCVVYS